MFQFSLTFDNCDNVKGPRLSFLKSTRALFNSCDAINAPRNEVVDLINDHLEKCKNALEARLRAIEIEDRSVSIGSG